LDQIKIYNNKSFSNRYLKRRQEDRRKGKEGRNRERERVREFEFIQEFSHKF
jgi:hypothetical protein